MKLLRKYPSYKDSGVEWIGSIPNSWEVKPLYVLFSELKNKNLGNKETNVLSLSYGKIVSRDIEKNMGLLPESFETYNIVTEGNIVLRLTDLQNDKRSLRCGYVTHKGIITSAYTTLQRKNDNINANFYYYLLHSYDVIKVYYNLGSGVRQSMSFSDLKRMPLLVMDKSEQTEIVKYLQEKTSEIDSLITDKENLLILLEEKRQAIITEVVTKGLNPNVKMKDSGVEWIGEIPDHWNLKRLGYLGRTQNGISKSSDEFGFGTPFVSYSDVYKNMELPLNVEGLVNTTQSDKSTYSIKKGDIFFTRTSETIEEIGIASTCMKTIENATFAGFLIRFRPSKNIILPIYSKYYFRSDLRRRYFVREMNIVTRASLSQDLLKGFPVLLPPIDEQLEIGEYLDFNTEKIKEAIRLLERQIDRLKEYRQSLIYEAVTGKIDVREYKKVLS